MGTITSGVGLISGIDTATLIEQLLAIESRPKLTLQARISRLQAQQAAMLDINARLLNMKTAAADLRGDKIFQSALAASSNESVLTATASAGALPGAYTFIVDRLVSTSQRMTRGFADRDQTGVGLDHLTFELGRGRLFNTTDLASLNGGDGVRRGKILVTDAAGGSATIDLSRAGDIGDVLDAINNDSSIDVSASVLGDRLVLTDNSGGAGNLTVANASGYFTATDLGIVGSDGGTGTLTGTAINRLADLTALASLNDSTGVVFNSGIGNTDFVITDRTGTAHNIVLGQWTNVGGEVEDAAATLEDVIARINDITAGAVTAAIAADGVSLELTDTTGGASNFSVTGTGANGDQTAIDLGILNAGVAAATISGERLIAGLNTVLTRRINGGDGLGAATTLTLTDRSGASVTVNNLNTHDSLADLITAVNDAASAGGVDIALSFNDAGSGLLATDSSGGVGNLIITGDAAAELGLDTTVTGVADDSFRGANLQHAYVSAASRLDDLNYGRGISTGTFRIVDANGESAVVDIGSDAVTLNDIITEINSRGLDINARVNDQGDGLVIEDISVSGTLAIRVDPVTGNTARDLGIAGEATDGDLNNFIDGSYERVIDLDPTATLDEVLSAINDANVPVSASIINTGVGSSPFRLSFTSEVVGAAGELIIDAEDFDLGLTTLSTGQNARVFFGSSDAAQALLITGTSNTLDGVINKVSIDLHSASSTPVTLTVTRDTENIVTKVKNLVTTFNDVLGRINQYDSYDAETEQKGVLLGNGTVARARDLLYRTLTGRATGVGTQFQYLSQIGIRAGSDGTIEFNEERFRAAFTEDPEAVANVLIAFEKTTEDEDVGEGVSTGNTVDTFTSLGIAEKFAQVLDGLTNSIDGSFKVADGNFTSAIELTEARIEQFDERLEARRLKLEREFAAMESALARLQGQQGSLVSLQNAVALAGTNFNRRR